MEVVVHLEFDESTWTDPMTGRVVRHEPWAGDYVYAVPECLTTVAVGDVVRVPHQHHPWCRTPDDPSHVRLTAGQVVALGRGSWTGLVRTIECGHETCAY